MKIGIITNLYPPFVRGGAEMIAAIEAEGLKKEWQHVFVVTTKPSLPGTALMKIKHKVIFQDEVNEVPIYRFTPFNLYYYLNDFKYPGFIRLLWHFFDIFNIFSYWAVKKILLKEQPDVVITHNLMGLGFLIPALLRKLKIKHIHTLHDVQLVTPSGLIIKDKEKSWIHKLFKYLGYIRIMRRLIGSPEIVVSPSKFLRDYYQRSNFFTKSKKIVLPNPIKRVLKIEKISSFNLELLFLGQINRAKGALELIKSFRRIKSPHLRLHIVGVGQDLRKAKQLAKGDKRIIFYGWLYHQDLSPLLKKIDVVVVPSLCYENSPTVIYESLSIGLPVMAADIGGVAELIEEGRNGWIFPAGDFDSLNKKIMSLYQQREKIALMTDNCRHSVQKYTIDKYVNKILTNINELK